MRERVIALAIAVAGCTAADARQAADEQIDPKADQLLQRMSNSLARARTLQFDAEHVLEAVTAEGEKYQFVARSRVAVKRPNMARSDRTGRFADATFYYDGKRVTIHGKRANLYAVASAPGNLDDALDFAREQLNLEAPAADLVYSDVYDGLMQDVVSGSYLGCEPMGDRSCHHLAFQGEEVDFQIWVENSPRALPCRYVITSKHEKGSPSFSVAFSNWQLDPNLPDSYFRFVPPRGATEIEFLSLSAERLEEQARRKAPRRQP